MKQVLDRCQDMINGIIDQWPKLLVVRSQDEYTTHHFG